MATSKKYIEELVEDDEYNDLVSEVEKESV